MKETATPNGITSEHCISNAALQFEKSTFQFQNFRLGSFGHAFAKRKKTRTVFKHQNPFVTMDILAEFFLIGLMLSGVKVFVRHLWVSLDRFNHSEKFLIHPKETDHLNLLTAVSHETNRRDSNYIRMTSTKGSNDRMKRLAFPSRESAPDYGAAVKEMLA